MKSELLDLAREREEESVSKWADTDGGILALLAEERWCTLSPLDWCIP